MVEGRTTEALIVDVWSDIACPWCYIGKRRFEEGLRRYHESGGARAVTLTYHSFELAPDTPVDFEGSEVDFLVSFKGLPVDRVQQMLDQVTQIAASVGLAYDFGSLRHTNTRKAHEVLHLAKLHGCQVEAKERLLRAYFVEGRHIGHDERLADVVAEVGLDRAEVIDALAARTYAPAVEDDVRLARDYGISAVPFFVIDGRYGISGAQEPQTFAQALTQAGVEAAGSGGEVR